MTLVLQTLPFLIDGFLVTLLVSVCVIVLSLMIGIPMGCVLVFGPLWARLPIRLYTDFVRGVPILVLIYFVYYGLPAIGVNLPSLLAAIAKMGSRTKQRHALTPLARLRERGDCRNRLRILLFSYALITAFLNVHAFQIAAYCP